MVSAEIANMDDMFENSLHIIILTSQKIYIAMMMPYLNVWNAKMGIYVTFNMNVIMTQFWWVNNNIIRE